MRFENCANEEHFLATKKLERHLIDHHKVFVGISGGSDSDIVLHLIETAIQDNKIAYRLGETPLQIDDCEIHYVFFDTGIEYEATKRHLDDLEKETGVKIERVRAKVPVPLGVKKYGVPFLSKYASEMIERLQRYDFDFANDGEKSFEELLEKYPKCKVALKRWCNKNGKNSSFNISRFAYLKEFMILNPPPCKISNKCCKGAKKDNGHDYIEENDCDLQILGLRKAEDGIRSTNIHSCYTESDNGGCDQFRLIWWFTDKDKAQYKEYFKLRNSDCYEVYGLCRTGCAGCPFGSRWEEELAIIEIHEPKLFKAVWAIFGDSYTYTRKYREYAKKKKQGFIDGQMSLFDNQGVENE